MPTDPKPLEELLDEWDDPGKDWGEAAGDEMARRLKALNERHKPQVKLEGPGTQMVCWCFKDWPCPDRELLEGRKR